jgi:sugar (pentulose or hexulose) kinase
MFRARRIMRRRAIGRTAAAGGAAFYAAKRGAGAAQEEEAPEAVGEAAAPEPAADPVEQIEELAELLEQGILTEEEFAAEKKKLGI